MSHGKTKLGSREVVRRKKNCWLVLVILCRIFDCDENQY